MRSVSGRRTLVLVVMLVMITLMVEVITRFVDIPGWRCNSDPATAAWGAAHGKQRYGEERHHKHERLGLQMV